MSGDTQKRWFYTAEQLKQSPSIKRGMTEAEELLQRQMTAQMIRQIGQELRKSCKRPSGLCINTAMVFMHRFYMFHSFQRYPPHVMAPCCVFLAAKSEETPVKLEYVIKTAHMIRNPQASSLSEISYERAKSELIMNENLLLQTLGFDLVVHHPHTSVIKCGDLVGAPKAVTQLAYELVTNSLHFSKMCLRYEPTSVACVCLFMAFKRYSLSIPKSKEGKEWWNYLDPKIDNDTIQSIMKEYVAIIEHCKRQFNKWMPNVKTPAAVVSTVSK